MSIAAMLAYSLAQFTWLLAGEGTGTLLLPITNTAGPVQHAQTPAAGLATLASLHLLGRSDEPPTQPQAPIVAPETRLNLTLRGLVALSSQQGALAIIAQGSGDEQAYKVGDSVPGGAVLHEIHADRVILDRNGRFETLTLPKEKMAAAGLTASAGFMTQGKGTTQDVARPIEPQQLQLLREKLQNPQEAMQLISAQPVMEGGKLKGYRVNPGRDLKLFRGVGLRPGDIVTSVNGIPLNDMSQLGALIEQLNSASHLDVTLERAGRETRLSLGLD